MNESDVRIFFKNYIMVNPSEMYWCDADKGLKRLVDSEHVEFVNALFGGEDVCKTNYVGPHRYKTEDSVEGDPIKFAELAKNIQRFGYDNSRNPKVKAVIDSCGRFVLTDGLHRSSIMHCLIKPLLCEVIYRDPQWIKLKYALYRINNEVRLYQPVNHSDFANWPSWRTDTRHRIDLIGAWLKKNMPKASYGLDMGCHTGNIAIGLSKQGYEMAGIDVDENALAAARLLSGMDRIGSDGITSFYEPHYLNTVVCNRFDFIVCLSLLNHHAVETNRHEDGWNLFRMLCGKSSVIFYDCPSPGDPVGGDTVMVDPKAMTDWLKESGVKGDGQVIEKRNENLQRTMMVWRCQA